MGETIIYLLATIGFLLSAYALSIERRSKDASYKAICDISERISCSKAVTSKEGKLLGLPNSIYGLLFYAIIAILNQLEMIQYMRYLAILSVFGSVYLAHISYVKQRNFCIVCTSVYIVNVLLLIVVSL